MRILVVDDEEHLRRMMRLTLEGVGYEVAEAQNGEAGLKLFGDGLRFDVTLLDQRMPGSMDGLETLRRMKLQRSDAPVIMVTAYATIDLAVDAMKLGATDFVRKPMTPDTLRHAVAAALAKHQRAMPAAAVGGQPPEPALIASAEQPPAVEIWTTNGFFVRRSQDSATAAAGPHHFVVRRGKAGTASEVTVRIDPGVLDEVDQECRKTLRESRGYWLRQAELALVNHLWQEAALPDDGRLIVRSVTPAMLDAAASWEGEI